MATTTITPDTDPDTITGRRCTFNRPTASGGTLAVTGTWTALAHAQFEGTPGQRGMAGIFDGPDGRTGLWIPYGTTVAF